jgi:hypothetical protein
VLVVSISEEKLGYVPLDASFKCQPPTKGLEFDLVNRLGGQGLKSAFMISEHIQQ